MRAFDYDKLLWGERQIRSVANMTREDACNFLKIAHDLNIRPQEDANQALLSVKEENWKWLSSDRALNRLVLS